MLANASESPLNDAEVSPAGGDDPANPSRPAAIAVPLQLRSSGVECSLVNVGDALRVVLFITPQQRGPVAEQAHEAFSLLRTMLASQPERMTVTGQTIFLRDAGDREECEHILAADFDLPHPVTCFVAQPPCDGAALAIEAWAIGGEYVQLERAGPHTLAVSYDGVRYVHCGGIEAGAASRAAYTQSVEAFQQMKQLLEWAGSGFPRVVRTWLYLGGITAPEGNTQRYHELNRARTDFYRHLGFDRRGENGSAEVYPASTGIGTRGHGLVMGCLAMNTNRDDVRLVALENPRQTPAYRYQIASADERPKFSRAMALVVGNRVTTWISGTASIVDSISRHPGDIEAQTTETINNIEELISPKNFARHGLRNTGECLQDLAKVRVYVKHREDFARCKAVCERRLGSVPALFLEADVCRPELLVEIEGVAFSTSGHVRQ